MPFAAILREVDQLHSVSTRLEGLAEQHAPIAEALLTIAGNVRNTATVLAVLVVAKGPSRSEHSRLRAQLLEIGTFLAVDAKLAKKGRFHECIQYFPCSADRAAYDLSGPLDAQTQTAISWVSVTKDVPVLRIDHVPTESKLLGMWQAAFRRVLDFKEMNRPSVHVCPKGYVK